LIESTPQIQGDEATKIKKLKAQEKKPRHNLWLIPLLLVILLVIDPAVVIKLIICLVLVLCLTLLGVLLTGANSYYQG
jgi:hypothetical protein